MNKDLRIAVLKTLAYADVFDYPLTEGEVWRFLISNKKFSYQSIQRVLNAQNKLIIAKHGYYSFKNRTHIIDKRIKKELYVDQKMKIAHKISSYLFHLPTVLLIGVSGGLAIRNAEKKDDIDLFVVTKTSTLWISRLILLVFLEMFGVRRKRGDKNVENKICLNMLIDQSVLGLPKKRQNLYTAHEVVQMKPIFDRDQTYQKFLNANAWVEKFLPNTLTGIRNQQRPLFIIHYSRLAAKRALFILEWLAKKVQLWSIKKHRTTEIISDSFLAFHPFDYEDKTLNAYKKRLNQYI